MLRTSLGFLLTSIGIVWNNSFNNVLVDFADTILSSFENKSGFRIPRFNEVLEDEIVEEDLTKTSYFINVLGVAVLGVVGVCLTIGIIEYNVPNTFNNVPVIGSTIEYIKDIYYIWTNLPDPKPPVTPDVPDQSGVTILIYYLFLGLRDC